METLSVTFAGDPQTYHVITDCNESDTCPGCGAGYHAGFIECEYCKRPVTLAVECAADGSWSPSIHGDGSGRALPEIA